MDQMMDIYGDDLALQPLFHFTMRRFISVRVCDKDKSWAASTIIEQKHDPSLGSLQFQTSVQKQLNVTIKNSRSNTNGSFNNSNRPFNRNNGCSNNNNY
eukprot:Pgem_evm1s10913